MKNLNNNLNFTSNPSYLGADRLWDVKRFSDIVSSSRSDKMIWKS